MKETLIDRHLFLNCDTMEGLEYLVGHDCKYDFVLTSPPYNAHRTDFYNGDTHINDSKDNEEYKQWLVSHFIEYDKLLKPNGVVVYNINYMSSKKNNCSNLFRIMCEIEDKTPFVIIEQICWKKDKGTPSKEARLTRVWENVFILIRKSDWETFHKAQQKQLAGKPNYIVAPNNDFVNKINKACFSSSFVEQALRTYGANKDSEVLDNFMGTGTTSIGCMKIGCGSTGIELDKTTYDFCLNRVREYMGDFESIEGVGTLFNIGD